MDRSRDEWKDAGAGAGTGIALGSRPVPPHMSVRCASVTLTVFLDCLLMLMLMLTCRLSTPHIFVTCLMNMPFNKLYIYLFEIIIKRF